MRWPAFIPSRDLWLAIAILVFLPAAIVGSVQTYRTMSSVLWNYRTGTWLVVEAQSEIQNTILAAKAFRLEPDEARLQQVTLKFEVFWSRIPLILDSDEGEDVRRIPAILANTNRVAEFLPLLERQLGLARVGEPGSILPFENRLNELSPLMEEMVRVLLVQDELRHQSGELAKDVWITAALLFVAIVAGGALIAGNLVKIRDVRRLLAQYKALDEARATQLLAIESSGEGVVMFDADGGLEYSNEAFHQLIGDDFQKTLTRTPWRQFLGEESAHALQQRLCGPGALDHWRGEISGKSLEGAEHPWEVHVWRRKEGGHTAIIRDLSDRKQAEQQREALLERLHHVDKMEAIGRLAGGVSHDFNNILAAVSGFGSLLEQDLADRPVQLRMVRQLLTAADRGKELVQSIMAYSRADNVERKLIDVGALCREAAAMAELVMPSGVSFNTTIDEGSLPIFGNAMQINRAVVNLCINARDALANKEGEVCLDVRHVFIDGGRSQGMQGRPTPSRLDAPRIVETVKDGHSKLRIGVLGQTPGTHVRIRVTDTGCGIPESVMTKMFDPFFTTKDVGEGTGLGLSSVLGIVTAHGGVVSVDSKVDEGTTFDILLPLQAEAVTTVTGAPQRPSSEPSIPAGLKVLVVDDDPESRAAFLAILERLGCEPSECGSAEEALAVLGDEPDMFDLIISDYHMPIVNGLQLISQLRQRGFERPIVLTTGRLQDVPVIERVRLGLEHIIVKPFTLSDVAAVVHDASHTSALPMTLPAPGNQDKATIKL
ncbi:ATP-binding protein [Dongia sp.]|uniref:hybrid sensor histidine kinase/response regulator n=1 Tax=Dongia sp. TaxID=1977262 RepID=UPI0035B1F0D4